MADRNVCPTNADEEPGKKQDPCVIDVFMSVIRFMEGGDPLPWWSFTAKRKKHMGSDCDNSR